MNGKKLANKTDTPKLGEGGMGQVWLAHDERLERDVAIKVLPPDFAADPERLERFEREAKTLAALDHPNIVHIYSVESATVEEEPGSGAQTVHFLTMQRVEGRQLSELIPDGGLPLERMFQLGIPLAEALAASDGGGVGWATGWPDRWQRDNEVRESASLRSEQLRARLFWPSRLPSEPLRVKRRRPSSCLGRECRRYSRHPHRYRRC